MSNNIEKQIYFGSKDELEGETEYRALSTIADIKRGSSPRPIQQYINKGNNPWLKITDIVNLKINDIEQKINDEGAAQGLKAIKGDIIYTNSATPGLAIELELDLAFLNDGFLLIRDIDKRINPKYLINYLNANREHILKKGAGSIFTNLNKEIVGNINIPIYSLLLQEKITHLLSQIDNLIYLVSEKKNIYNSLYLEDVLINSLRDTKVYKLHEITVIHNSARIPITANIRPIGSVPYYGANGIQSYIDGYTHKGVNLLIAEDGANDITNYPLNLTHGEVWVNNHAHVVTGEYFYVSTEYLFYYLKTVNFSPYLTGAGRYKLNLENLKQINIEIPSLKKQQIITSFLSQMDKLIEIEEKKLEQLEKMKKYHLQQFFN